MDRLTQMRQMIRGWFPLVELEFDPPMRSITLYVPGTRCPIIAIHQYPDASKLGCEHGKPLDTFCWDCVERDANKG